MSRPTVSVVMPFAGDPAAAATAEQVLAGLDLRPGDELILADNSGLAPSAERVTVVRATAERSPAYARNAGAEHAQGEWILFLDADCRAPGGLLDSYFAEPVAPDVGALAGEVSPAPDAHTLAARYGSTRSFLSQAAHLAHPFLPRAAAANLLVRRAAFEQVGGFYEGVRAAEDTDFSWRLQSAGWRLELRPEARVEHRYRATIGELRSQWRGYAAGRAWLARRYEGFAPEPAVRRAIARAWRRRSRRARDGGVETAPGGGEAAALGGDEVAPNRASRAAAGALDRGRFLALDVLLAGEELSGLMLSNRPTTTTPAASTAASPIEVVLVADRFPARNDPLVEFARALDGARVEAAARPKAMSAVVARELEVAYREDDGFATRALAVVSLVARHPLRCAGDLAHRGAAQPPLAALAPAVLRLQRDRAARVLAVGGEGARDVGRRLARLAGRRFDSRQS